MILIEDISKEFNRGEPTAIKALSNVSINVGIGEFVVVVGSNGSGKSTLLNSIAGNFLCDAGKIIIDGNDVSKKQDFERAKWISRVFQNPLQGTAPELSIIDNFRLASLRTHSKFLNIGITANFEKKVKESIASLNMGLEEKIHQPVGSLSGGQRQALTLLMSVFDTSKILLLDEPTAALDPKSSTIVMQTANRLIKQFNLTAILVTHNLKEATSYGDRIIQMNEGSVCKDLKSEQKNELSAANIFEWF